MSPAPNDGAGLGQGGEDVLVQAFIAQLAVEALAEPFCHGLPGAM